MKFISSFAIVIILFVSCKQEVKGPNGVTYNSPVEYNDYIVNRQTSLMKKIMSFGKIVQFDLDSAINMLDKFEKETDVTITELSGMPAYKKDSTLRDAAIRSFRFYKKVFSRDYRQLIAVRKEGRDQTEEGVKEMDDIVDRITREEEVLDKEFHKAQRNFASKNKMKLVYNSMEKDIDNMNE